MVNFYSVADTWQDQVEAFRRIAAKLPDGRLGKAANYRLLICFKYIAFFHLVPFWVGRMAPIISPFNLLYSKRAR
ncbi:hypothetical protein [Sphingopyxis fribergensis]|uniref:hypothetical protein n=1 Tax=Sphingopyxis fribergensis TaxID=1515612 RepID=UPI000689FE33|nr:hypothetical protein [Sphingopyxis fribergensis]